MIQARPIQSRPVLTSPVDRGLNRLHKACIRWCHVGTAKLRSSTSPKTSITSETGPLQKGDSYWKLSFLGTDNHGDLIVGYSQVKNTRLQPPTSARVYRGIIWRAQKLVTGLFAKMFFHNITHRRLIGLDCRMLKGTENLLASSILIFFSLVKDIL